MWKICSHAHVDLILMMMTIIVLLVLIIKDDNIIDDDIEDSEKDIDDDEYILLDVLFYNIAVYFYEFCSILTSPQGESKYKERVKIYSDIVHQNIS